MRYSSLALSLLGLISISGCATGSLVETQAFHGALDQYKVVQIQAEPNPNIENDRKHRAYFESKLIRELAGTKLFEEVSANPQAKATLKITYKLTQVKIPNTALNILGGGSENSEVFLSLKLEDISASRTLASLDVSGNSSNKSRSSIGGFSITSTGALTEKAFDNAASQVETYISKRARPEKK